MLRRRRRWMPGWVALGLVGLGISGDGAVSARPAPFAVRLAEIAEFDQPTVMATRAGDDLLYVGEKTGRVRAVTDDGEVLPEMVLDLSAEVSSGNEQGLVGLAFDPDGDRLYAGITDLDGHSRILEFTVEGHQVVTSTRREVLFLPQPHDIHNNGQLLFGPDGLLYLGFGDGGWVREEDHRSQDLGNLYGKVLRIDPRPVGERPYQIPADNPFVRNPNVRPEIWLYGLRQPWRFSFDRRTSDFWLGDVGHHGPEEIDFLPAGVSGVNLGWDAFEGSLRRDGPEPADHVGPVYEYPHNDGRCVVVGGYVYRGDRIPGLAGYYIFGDLCSGRLTALWQIDGEVYETLDLGVETEFVTSLGEDHNGELYVLSLKGGLYRLEPGEPPADR